MSVERDIRWELLARMCPNCTGMLLFSSSEVTLSCILSLAHIASTATSTQAVLDAANSVIC